MAKKFDVVKDPPEVARALVERYGIRAGSVARWKALWAKNQADRSLMEAWQWVAGAADEMLRAEPD